MRKKADKDNIDEATDFICESYHLSEDLMEKYELGAYLNKNNQPNIDMMERSDEITVEQVLLIGGHMTLKKAHDLLHEDDAKDVEVSIQQVMKGTKKIKEVAPKDMPDEMVDVLQELVDLVRDAKASVSKLDKKKGKK